jgi:hypothetical protein
MTTPSYGLRLFLVSAGSIDAAEPRRRRNHGKHGGAFVTLWPEHALAGEKRREDRLRDLGWQVVRWVWAELFAPAAMLDRLNRAFARGRRAAWSVWEVPRLRGLYCCRNGEERAQTSDSAPAGAT